MPGYQMQGDGSLGYGKIRPLPDATLSKTPLAPHLMARANRQQALSAQAQAPMPQGPFTPDPRLLRGPGGAGMMTNATSGMGAMVRDPIDPSITPGGMKAYGIASMAGRNQLERNLDNDQVNHRMGMGAAMAGQPAPAYQSYVGGAHPTDDLTAAYTKAFPSSAHGAGVLATAPAVGALAGNAPPAPAVAQGPGPWQDYLMRTPRHGDIARPPVGEVPWQDNSRLAGQDTPPPAPAVPRPPAVPGHWAAARDNLAGDGNIAAGVRQPGGLELPVGDMPGALPPAGDMPEGLRVQQRHVPRVGFAAPADRVNPGRGFPGVPPAAPGVPAAAPGAGGHEDFHNRLIAQGRAANNPAMEAAGLRGLALHNQGWHADEFAASQDALGDAAKFQGQQVNNQFGQQLNDMGPIPRSLLEGVANGTVPLKQLEDAIAQHRARQNAAAAPPPVAPGVPVPPVPQAPVVPPVLPPEPQASARLTDPMAQTRIGSAHMDQLFPENKIRATESLRRAQELGYPVGPGHENEQFDQDYRARMKAYIGDQTWQAAGQEPQIGTLGFGYPGAGRSDPLSLMLSGYNPIPGMGGGAQAQADYERARRFAAWIRGRQQGDAGGVAPAPTPTLDPTAGRSYMRP